MVKQTTPPMQSRAASPSLALDPESPNVLRRSGGSWQVHFDGDMFYLRGSTGLDYLAHLLANPGRKIPAVRFVEGTSGGAERSSGPGVHKQQICHLDELRAELDEAEVYNDVGRVARLRDDIEALVEQLARDAGICGRTEEVCTAWERARKRVSNALRRTLGRIERHCPPLGAHLAVSVRTGAYCVYLPDPYSPIRWLVDLAALD